MRKLAEYHGDTLTEETILFDWDISGAAKYTAKRKGYRALNEAVESGRATAVYSYSLSRLARSTLEVLRFFEMCKAHNVPVRLVADSIDTSTASGRMLLTNLASVATFESEVSSKRRLGVQPSQEGSWVEDQHRQAVRLACAMHGNAPSRRKRVAKPRQRRRRGASRSVWFFPTVLWADHAQSRTCFRRRCLSKDRCAIMASANEPNREVQVPTTKLQARPPP